MPGITILQHSKKKKKEERKQRERKKEKKSSVTDKLGKKLGKD